MNDNITLTDKLLLVVAIAFVFVIVLCGRDNGDLSGCVQKAWVYGAEICVDNFPSPDPPLVEKELEKR